MTSCIGVLMLHITFSKYDCIIVHKAYYVLTCTCVSINSFHSHSHSHIQFMKDFSRSSEILFIILFGNDTRVFHVSTEYATLIE